jgi:hypothetical protein
MEFSGQLHAQAALSPGERALGTHCIGDWMGPEPLWALWRSQKLLDPPRNQTLAIQPVATPTELSVTVLNPVYCVLLHTVVLNGTYFGYEIKPLS